MIRLRRGGQAAGRNRRLSRLEALEARLLLTGEWQNPCNPLDNSADGVVTPIDVLIPINDINAGGSRALSPPAPGEGPPPYVDTSGDDFLAPLDALLVINAINGWVGGGSFQFEAGLIHDTAPRGETNDDRLTWDARLSGRLAAVMGVTEFQVRLDDGVWIERPLDCTDFSFDPELPQDGSADGPHTVSFRARDHMGNLVAFPPFDFVLDTQAPPLTLALDPAYDTAPSGDGATHLDEVSLTGSTDPDVTVELAPITAEATANDQGSFTFEQVVLAHGANSFSATTWDAAGNMSITEATVRRQECSFGNNLAGWTVSESGGSPQGAGTVIGSGCSAELREGDSLLVALEKEFVIPDEPSVLQLTWYDAMFDQAAGGMQDAFEASLLDADGRSLVHSIHVERDAFFNLGEHQTVALATGTELAGQTVQLNLSALPVGASATLVLRMVNNDGDTGSSVRLSEVTLLPSPSIKPPAGVVPGLRHAPRSPIDVSQLLDITGSIENLYGSTSFKRTERMLSSEWALQNVGDVAFDAPILVGVNVDDPDVLPLDADGFLPDGTPFYDVSAWSHEGDLTPGESTEPRYVLFSTPEARPFTYSLQVFGKQNQPPVILSLPPTEIPAGGLYSYDVEATDPDADEISYQLDIAPTGMSIDAVTGIIDWHTSVNDAGAHAVWISARDEHGRADTQRFDLQVRESAPNRPPVFTSTPVVAARAASTYTYAATARDADGDALVYSLTESPAGMTIQDSNGAIEWLPDFGQVGAHPVNIRVSDSAGGLDDQAYIVQVGLEDGNHPPLIVSDPVTQFGIAGTGNSPIGAVTPARIDLDLEPGETSAHTVSIRLPDNSTAPVVDVFLLFDDTGSFTAAAPSVVDAFPQIISQLQTEFPQVNFGFGVGRFEDYYGDGQGADQRPFTLNQPVISTNTSGFQDAIDSALRRTAPGGGGDTVETLVEGIWQTASGVGWDHNVNGDTTDSGPAGLLWTQRYPGLRPGGYRGSSGDVPAFDTFGDPVEYGFRLVDLADASAISMTDVTTGHADPPMEAGIYRFEGSVGERFVYDFISGYGPLGGIGSSSQVAVYGPANQQLLKTGFGVDYESMLEQDGSYILVVEGNSSDTPHTYEIRTSLAEPAVSSPLTLGQTISGNIGVGGERDEFTFTLPDDRLLYFDTQTEHFVTLRWSLEGTPGTIISNQSLNAFQGIGALNRVLDLPAGDYTLTLDGDHLVTGYYQFALHELAAAAPITLGIPIEEELTPASSTDLFRFDVQAGEQFYFDVIDPGGAQVSWRLIDPFGTEAFSSVFVDVGVLELDASGTYTLLVEGRDFRDGIDATYSLQVQQVERTSLPLDLGATTSGTIGVPGEDDRFTFQLNAATLLYLDSLTDNQRLRWSLAGPSGQIVQDRSLRHSDSWDTGDPVFVAAPGAYTVTITGSGDATGDYAFRMWDLATAEPLTPAVPADGVLEPGIETALYRFDANAGDTFFFDVVSRSFTAHANPSWRLIDPFGSVQFHGPLADNDNLTLTAAGSYTLLVEGRIINPGIESYQVVIWPVHPAPPSALLLNTDTTGELAAPGETDRFTFSLPADALLYFDSLANNNRLNWTLEGPAGTLVAARDFQHSDAWDTGEPIIQAAAGDYSLTIDGQGDQAGEYAFRLWDLASAGPVTLGVPFAGELDPGVETDLYRFDGRAGETFQLDVVSRSYTPNATPMWRLIGPYGRTLFGDYVQDRTVELTATGPHTLLIEGRIIAPAVESYEISVESTAYTPPPPYTGDPLSLGDAVNGTLEQAEELDRFTFQMGADSKIYVDTISAASSHYWKLAGPPGTVIDSRAFSNSEKTTSFDPLLTLPAGDYQLTIGAWNSGTGDYSLRLTDVRTVAAFSPGTPIQGALTPVSETGFHAFEAEAGKPYFFDVGAVDGFRPGLRLIGPAGNTLLSQTLAPNGDIDPIVLATEGRHTLLIEGPYWAWGDTTYGMKVIPVTDETHTLSWGQLVTGTLQPGQRHFYDFQTSVTTHALFDSQTNHGAIVWSLEGPAGTVVENWALSHDWRDRLVTLPPGDHRLTIDGLHGTEGDFTFQLIRLEDAVPISIGTPVSGDLTPELEADVYRFDVTAGMRLFFDSQVWTGGGTGNWRLVDPFGQTIFQKLFRNTDYPATTFTIPGTYSLLVEGAVNQTGDAGYQFEIVDAEDVVQALDLGIPIEGSIDVPGVRHRFDFTLSNRTLIQYDTLNNTGSMLATLSGPTGTLLSQLPLLNNTDRLLDLHPGDYELLVEGGGDATGPYALQLLDLTPGMQIPIAVDTTVTGELIPGRSTEVYEFQGEQGQRLFFDDLQASTGPSNWQLLNPQGRTLFDTRFHMDINDDRQPLELLQDGVYRLLIKGDAVADNFFSFVLREVEDDTVGIQLDETLTGEIGVPGEQDHFTFTLSESYSKLYFDALAWQPHVDISLSGPTGKVWDDVPINSTDQGHHDPVFRLGPGDYELTLDAFGEFVLPYQFRLLDLRSAIPIDFGQVITGDLDPGNGTALYSFDAEGGDELSFEVLNRTGPVSIQWRLVDAHGDVVFRSPFDPPFSDDISHLVTEAGTYTLMMEGRIDLVGPGTFSFRVNRTGQDPDTVDVTIKPFTLGVDIIAPILRTGQFDVYQFDGYAGQRVYFDGYDVNAYDIGVKLTAPSGKGVFRLDRAHYPHSSVMPFIDVGPITLRETGTYELAIFSQGPDEAFSEYSLPPEGSLGGAGFRAGALPIIIASTDAPTRYGEEGIDPIVGIGGVSVPLSHFGGSATSRSVRPAAGFQETTTALNQLGALLVGLGTGVDANLAPRSTLEGLSILTGAVNGSATPVDSGILGDPIELGEPLYFLIRDGLAANVGQSLETAISAAIEQVRFRADVVAANPNVILENLTGVIPDVGAGSDLTFDVRFTGDNAAQDFDLMFVKEGSGVLLGSIPVTSTGDYLYPVKAVDPDGDALSFHLDTGPAGAVLDAVSGRLDWSPPSEGIYDFVVRVEDGRGGTASQSFQLHVSPDQVNQDPEILSTPPTQATFGQTYEYAVTATDTDGDQLGHFLVDAPEGMSIDRISGLVTWSPTVAQLGDHDVSVRVIDGRGGGVAQPYVLSVAPPGPNEHPTITSVPLAEAEVGSPHVDRIAATDADGDPLRFDLLVFPQGMAVDEISGRIAWLPSQDQEGVHDVILRVRDNRGGVGLQSFQLTAFASDSAPVIKSRPVGPATADVPYQYLVRAQDADGDVLSYALNQAPAGMQIDPETGIIRWTPTIGQVGVHPVDVTVRDERQRSAEQAFDLEVVNASVNTPPLIESSPRRTIALGGSYRYFVQTTDPDPDPLAYALEEGPAGMTIDRQGWVDWAPAELGTFPVTVRVTDGRGGSAVQPFQVRVVTFAENGQPRITTDPTRTAVAGQLYAYDATGEDADGDPLIWTLDSGPRGMSLHPQCGTVRWTPTAYQEGEHRVVLEVIDGQGGAARQDFVITVLPVNTPPVIVSSPAVEALVDQDYTYSVQARDDQNDRLTFTLEVGPSGMAVAADTGVVNWLPSAAQVGNHAVTVMVEDGRGGIDRQRYELTVAGQSPNELPVVTSRPPFRATLDELYRYQVTADDPEAQTLRFELREAPDGMSIDPGSGLVEWTPAVGQLGSHAVTVAAFDPPGAGGGQTYTLTVLATNRAPEIRSVPSAYVTAGVLYKYDVLAHDPDGDALAYRLDEAPSGMIIDALGRLRWNTANVGSGDHTVAVVVTDARNETVRQEYSLSVGADTTPPEVSVILTPNPVAVGIPATLVVRVGDDVGVVDFSVTVAGAPLPLSELGTASLQFDAAGERQIVAWALDAAGNRREVSDNLLVVDPSVTGAPHVEIASPNDGEEITSIVDVRGTVDDDDLLYYKLEYGLPGAPPVEFARGTVPVTDGVLGTLDSTLLVNDSYTVRLTAVDTGANLAVTESLVHVAGHQKLGRFTLYFVDMGIPVAGTPITVARTYDSSAANRTGDLGYGWRLDFRDTNMSSSVPKTGLERFGVYHGLRAGDRVYLTVPGGRRTSFRFEPEVRNTFFGQEFYPAFVPERGEYGQLVVERVRLQPGSDGFRLYGGGGRPYNPADPLLGGGYTYVSRHGVEYHINARTGALTSLQDRRGNRLDYSASGIASNTGKRVDFLRDSQGRITTIIDPNGNRVEYRYDTRGDLVSVQDRTGNITQFAYRSDPAHYLEDVHNPLGHRGVRSEYDHQGRVVRVIDAEGNEILHQHDPASSTQTIVDPLGHPTVYTYDTHGNVLTETNAAGGTIERTYDAQHNMLTEKDALGRVTTFAYDASGNVVAGTNALGEVSRYTYDAYSRVTTATDPLGNTTKNAYDSSGNLVRRTLPDDTPSDETDNPRVLYSYDHAGRPLSITDPLDRTRTMEYDAAGNLARRVDAGGNATTYSYDANGNQLSSTTTQTRPDGPREIVTRREYDAEGRLLKTVDAEGQALSTLYDAAGRRIATTDPLGRTTQFEYDERGQLVTAILADDTPNDPDDNPRVRTEYDAAGRVVAEVDENGGRTEFRHDAAGRLTETIFPDDTPGDVNDNPRSRREYDAAGQLTAEVDELGHRTEFEYDALGRKRLIRDALLNEITMERDLAGRLVAVQDGRGNRTTFDFDEQGRQTRTVQGDAFTLTTYDAAGQVVREQDENGNVTEFEYDDVGRLVSVVDALQQKTEYAYDELGNRVAQIDARDNTTTYEYDGVGRRVAVVLPEGQRSTSTYDATGNLVARTDFNGDEVSFVYDATNRLVRKDFPDDSFVSYTYTAGGQRETATDARGTTRYAYDERRRLIRRTDPDNRTIEYAYDDAGGRTSLKTSFGETEYAFDELHRLKTVTSPGDDVATYSYDANGNLVRTEFPNGVVETREFDEHDRLTLLESNGASGVFAGYRYDLDKAGNRIKVTELGGRIVEYEYDALYRLLGETITDPVGGDRTMNYTYDAVGNRLTRVDSLEGLTTYEYDDNDRLLAETIAGNKVRLEYDANGNTLRRIDHATDQVLAAWEWDYQNRLVAADTDGDDVNDVENVYQVDGLRVARIVDGEELRFLVDDNRDYAQVVEEYTPGGVIKVSYVYGTDLVQQSRTEDGSQYVTSFFHVDGLGSTRALTDIDGEVSDRYDYDAFGRLIQQVGFTGNVYLFAGEQRDVELGLDYLRSRYVAPESGRMHSMDSYEGDPMQPLSRNRYVYARDNPVNLIDPGGHVGIGSIANQTVFARLLKGVALPPFKDSDNIARSQLKLLMPLKVQYVRQDKVFKSAGWTQGQVVSALSQAMGAFDSLFNIILSPSIVSQVPPVDTYPCSIPVSRLVGEFGVTRGGPAKVFFINTICNPKKNAVTYGINPIGGVGTNLVVISNLTRGRSSLGSVGRVLAHELGHSLSLKHKSLADNLMRKGTDGPPGTVILTEAPDNQYADAREYGIDYNRFTGVNGTTSPF